ncbi:MAG TPA: hypothetical protein VNE62_09115 [Actinomycetota bacterium]|nr:hypothetical protein [Actinomycetota bacterium]
MRLPRMLFALVLFLGFAPAPAGASHESRSFEQPLWFQWEKAALDVLIVPPNHGQIYNARNGVLNRLDPGELNPLTTSYLAAIENSVADFHTAVNLYGSQTLRNGLKTNVYVLGRDNVPQAALTSPEVVIVTDENKGSVLGVAVSSRPCIVNNSKLFVTSFSYEDMFNVNAQEYGHCLGLEHVPGHVDGPDGDKHDPMNGSYPHSPGADGTDLHCVSNLNVLGLEEVFRRPLTGARGANVVKMPISQYVRRSSC